MHINKMVKVKEEKENLFKKFWEFLKEDSWQSMVVSLILAFLFIKFIFFPSLSFFTGSALPLVIVESCSMHHSRSLSTILDDNIYNEFNIDSSYADKFPFKNGLEKGDIIFVTGAKNAKVGDVIIFNAGQQYPIIHRIVSSDGTVTTKGDNNPGLLPIERNVSKDKLVGKAALRIPYLGWIKLIFYEPFRAQSARGLCN
jgi:signal peptidase I